MNETDEIEKELRALCHRISATGNCAGVNCEDCPLNTELKFKAFLSCLPKSRNLLP